MRRGAGRYGGAVHSTRLRRVLQQLVGGLGLYAAVAMAQGDSTVQDAVRSAATLEARGAALYDGRLPLSATVRGQDFGLPATVTACIRCHESSADASRKTSIPKLNRDNLLGLQSRRGGPPSAYTAAEFCSALTTSIDPAGVMLEKTMPQYALDEADCLALWTYLTARS